MQDPLPSSRQWSHARRTRRLIVWALLLALCTLALTNVLTLHALSGVRAYVGGESLWTKGQKDASYHLLRYSESFDQAELASFEAAIAVPLGDRAARLALDAPAPDKAAARRGLVQGGNHPDDVEAIARLGGDEFAIALTGVRESAHAQVIAEKVVAAAHTPFEVGSLTLHVGASVGIAFGTDGTSGWRDLVARADAMLYKAKAGGKGRHAGID